MNGKESWRWRRKDETNGKAVQGLVICVMSFVKSKGTTFFVMAKKGRNLDIGFEMLMKTSQHILQIYLPCIRFEVSIKEANPMYCGKC